MASDCSADEKGLLHFNMKINKPAQNAARLQVSPAHLSHWSPLTTWHTFSCLLLFGEFSSWMLAG